MTNSIETSRPRRFGAIAAGVVAAFAAGGAAIVWVWNTIAVEFFTAPAVGFRHALAAEVAVAIVGALFAAVARAGARRDEHAGAAR